MTINLLPAPFHVGAFEIRRVMEMQVPFRPMLTMFPSATEAELRPYLPRLQPWCVDAQLRAIIAVQSYLVRTPRHTILLDTCIGCGKKNTRIPEWANRTDRAWLARLGAAGVAPEAVSHVLCTHLHSDHSGWNTRLLDGRWVPTFPNAQYIFARTEVEHAAGQGTDQYHENVLPVIEAGQAVLVDTDHMIEDGIWLEPTPGHTPGHVAVHLESEGQHALMWGDLLHSPVQCARPDWWFSVDTDGAQSTQSRKRVLAAACEHNHLILPAHFPSPSLGRIAEEGDHWWFRYESGAPE